MDLGDVKETENKIGPRVCDVRDVDAIVAPWT